MRLIDADALLAELTSFYKKVEEESRYTGNRTINVSWDDAITTIKNTPTIEPEPSESMPVGLRTIAKHGCTGRSKTVGCSAEGVNRR